MMIPITSGMPRTIASSFPTSATTMASNSQPPRSLHRTCPLATAAKRDHAYFPPTSGKKGCTDPKRPPGRKDGEHEEAAQEDPGASDRTTATFSCGTAGEARAGDHRRGGRRVGLSEAH